MGIRRSDDPLRNPPPAHPDYRDPDMGFDRGGEETHFDPPRLSEASMKMLEDEALEYIEANPLSEDELRKYGIDVSGALEMQIRKAIRYALGHALEEGIVVLASEVERQNAIQDKAYLDAIERTGKKIPFTEEDRRILDDIRKQTPVGRLHAALAVEAQRRVPTTWVVLAMEINRAAAEGNDDHLSDMAQALAEQVIKAQDG